MGAKVYADRMSAAAMDAEPGSEGEPELSVEPEVQAIAAWFEALPLEWQRYFDHEARCGRQAYGPA